jgi:hypothetical protein
MQPDDGQHTQPNMKKTTLLLTALASLTIANYGLAFETAQNTAATAITSLPAVISAPGNYYLAPMAPNYTASSAVNGWLITIQGTRNVTLDLNNQALSNYANYSPYGILISGSTNVTVQNGTLGSYDGLEFCYPIYLQNAAYCTFRNITSFGQNSGVLDVSGNHNQFYNSTFWATTNASVYLYNSGSDLFENCTLTAKSTVWGAISIGNGCWGNVFQNVNISFDTATPPYYGLYLKAADMVKGVAANAPVNVTFIYGTANVVD